MNKKAINRLKAVSLFSCIGVGEFYLKDIGIDIVVANDIESRRCQVYNFFHPETEIICGDIIDPNIKGKILSAAERHNVDLVIATPPCQGMSSVGKNKKDGT